MEVRRDIIGGELMRVYDTICTRRSGVTLTEVLMSMFIMSLGVMFVVTLFPVSVLRTVEASQMTSGTILRYSAESMIDVVPGLVHDPDGDGDQVPHYRGGDPAMTLHTRNYLVDPLGFFTHLLDQADPIDPDITLPTASHGWVGSTVDVNGNTTGVLNILRRYDGGIAARNPSLSLTSRADVESLAEAAAGLVYSNDRWEKVVDVDRGISLGPNPAGFQVNNVTLAGADLSQLVPGISRVSLYGTYGRISQSYAVTAVDLPNSRIDWSAAEFLPRGMVTSGVSRVTVENNKRLFSWFLTVRKDPDGKAGIDVVVMFNREIAPKNEVPFEAFFGSGTGEVYVNVGAAEPFLKKGGYVFDVENARWYRIADFVAETNMIAGKTFDLRITTEDSVRQPGTVNDHDGDGLVDGFAVFMPGIVDVFPLSPRELPELAL